MKILSIFFILLFLIFITFRKNNFINRKKLNSLQRFKKTFKGRNHFRDRLVENHSNSLMKNPEENIKIGKWDKEDELREKADIHRARLHKYGRSKMNGEMLYMGPKGGVYKYTSGGKRKYL